MWKKKNCTLADTWLQKLFSAFPCTLFCTFALCLDDADDLVHICRCESILAESLKETSETEKGEGKEAMPELHLEEALFERNHLGGSSRKLLEDTIPRGAARPSCRPPADRSVLVCLFFCFFKSVTDNVHQQKPTIPDATDRRFIQSHQPCVQ